MRPQNGFTVVELLVAMAVLAMLIGLSLPIMSKVRQSGRVTACLSNLRNLGQAHWQYMGDHKGRFIDAGLPHGGLANEEVAWVNTLDPYYDNKLVLRSPVDLSRHWALDDGSGNFGVPVTGTADRFRLTSYGCNNYLTSFSPAEVRADRLSRVPDAANTVHFLIMTFAGSFAGADHVHVEEWWNQAAGPQFPPVHAASQVQTNAYDGPEKSWASRSGYGFLDGHVESVPFSDVYRNRDTHNRFDPEVSKFYASRISHSN